MRLRPNSTTFGLPSSSSFGERLGPLLRVDAELLGLEAVEQRLVDPVLDVGEVVELRDAARQEPRVVRHLDHRHDAERVLPLAVRLLALDLALGPTAGARRSPCGRLALNL
jgi:hypothetical protein